MKPKIPYEVIGLCAIVIFYAACWSSDNDLLYYLPFNIDSIIGDK